MPEDRHIYGEVNNKTSLRDVLLQIRKDVDSADAREALTALYRPAGYLITLSYAQSWQEKFGDDIQEIRESNGYCRTESKYKGGAKEMYVTYDLEQKTRGANTAMYPKAKCAYIAGDTSDWCVGQFSKRSGKEVFGVQAKYRQGREPYERSGHTAKRSDRPIVS